MEPNVNDAEVQGAEVVTNKAYEVVRPYDEAIIDEHAAKCGGRRLLKEIIVTTDDDYQFCYLVKRPSRNVLMAVADKKKGDKPDIEAIEKIMMGLVLEGDKTTLDLDGAVSSQLLSQLGKLVRSASSDIKKI